MDLDPVSSTNPPPQCPLQPQIQDIHDQVQGTASSRQTMAEPLPEQQDFQSGQQGKPSSLEWFNHRGQIEKLYRSHGLNLALPQILRYIHPHHLPLWLDPYISRPSIDSSDLLMTNSRAPLNLELGSSTNTRYRLHRQYGMMRPRHYTPNLIAHSSPQFACLESSTVARSDLCREHASGNSRKP